MKKNRMMDGYFTVEAALLFPFVTGVILLVIYMLFWEYDRCLMEQSTAMLALRGCTLQITEEKYLAAEVLRQSREDDKPYVAWNLQEAKICVKGNEFIVSRAGSLKFPFKGLDFWNGGNSWEYEVCYENCRINPVLFIRSFKKLGGK
ncbi:MAG: hypothetical protein IJ716_17385 [Lachnospiraceae bacterium]|nr:hypothetical protein [Lachnospiraceae bacterium]